MFYYNIDCTVQESKYDGVLGFEPCQVPAGVRGDQWEVRRTAGQLLYSVPLHLPLGQRRGVRHRHETNGEQSRDYKEVWISMDCYTLLALMALMALWLTICCWHYFLPIRCKACFLSFTGHNSVVPLWRGWKNSLFTDLAARQQMALKSQQRFSNSIPKKYFP